jgi:predicted GIY-YIG superfamily endonuclease
MSFCVYILRCADNSYYTGHTDNLEERIAKHQAGEIEGYTSTRLPVELLFSEEFPTREEALACERQIKGWSRKKKEALMRGVPPSPRYSLSKYARIPPQLCWEERVRPPARVPPRRGLHPGGKSLWLGEVRGEMILSSPPP